MGQPQENPSPESPDGTGAGAVAVVVAGSAIWWAGAEVFPCAVSTKATEAATGRRRAAIERNLARMRTTFG